MNINYFPIRNESQEVGRKGEIFFENFITTEFEWIYRPVHQETDNGIDGYVDIVIDGYVTGQYIAVQIKTGKSYLKNRTKYGIKYYVGKKHINYYKNNPAFVLLIVIDIDTKKMYWELFDFEKIINEGNKW